MFALRQPHSPAGGGDDGVSGARASSVPGPVLTQPRASLPQLRDVGRNRHVHFMGDRLRTQMRRGAFAWLPQLVRFLEEKPVFWGEVELTRP